MPDLVKKIKPTQFLGTSLINPKVIGGKIEEIIDAINNLSSGSGGLPADNGTVSLPSIAFTNDLDCGLYRIGTNNIGLSIGGTKLIDFSAGATAFTGYITATNSFRGGVASVAAPIFACSTATSTGIYFPSTAEVGITIGGTKVGGFDAIGLSMIGNLNAATYSVTEIGVAYAGVDYDGAVAGISITIKKGIITNVY